MSYSDAKKKLRHKCKKSNIKYEDLTVAAKVAKSSIVGIKNKINYPLSYGNYFSLYVDKDKDYLVNNFHYENFNEAKKRFLLDSKVKIRIFSEYKDYPIKSISILDERIPQEWYLFWNRPYCNGQLTIGDVDFIKKNISKRFHNNYDK